MLRDTYASLQASGEPAKTMLVGGFVLASGALAPIVVVLGYLARILRDPPEDDGPLPVFEAWRAVVADGVRMSVVWSAYAAVPLGVLLGWLAAYAAVADSLALPETVPALVAVLPGTVVGTALASLTAVQLVRNQIVAFGPGEVVRPPYALVPLDGLALFGLFSVAYAVSLLASLYVVPAAFANVARERTLRAGFDRRRLAPVLRSRRYLKGWSDSMIGWTVAVVCQWGWLAWRLANPGRDVEVMSVGPLPVVAIPTPVGIRSSAFTLAAAFVAFYALVAGYAVVGRAWDAVHGPHDESSRRE